MAAPPPSAHNEPHRPAPWLLLVENDPDLREIVLDVLTLAAVPAVAAENGAAALDALRSRTPPAVILLDLVMEGMDGAAFARTYRDLPGPHAPIVIFTAMKPLPSGLTPEALGAAEVLRKPFDIDVLTALVRRYLGP